ncbi:formate dehydrogenase accessory protein FdhE, partial [Bosea sp. CER48]|uniref:formate dehydrogenase accessory protein FdhE domain-containing protein n=1 Tax=Bosea sp. CER48 TaxID=3377035 RepID=UPI00382B2D71
MSEDPGFAALEDVGIAERDKPPFIRLPNPESLFGLRAIRFAALAPGHQLEAYLVFLSELSKVQDRLAR